MGFSAREGCRRCPKHTELGSACGLSAGQRPSNSEPSGLQHTGHVLGCSMCCCSPASAPPLSRLTAAPQLCPSPAGPVSQPRTQRSLCHRHQLLRGAAAPGPTDPCAAAANPTAAPGPCAQSPAAVMDDSPRPRPRCRSPWSHRSPSPDVAVLAWPPR